MTPRYEKAVEGGGTKGSELYYVPVVSGLIAGESLVAAIIAIACTVVDLRAVK